MEKKTNKTIKFIKKYKKELAISGILGAGALTYYIAHISYKAGVKFACIAGFDATLDWFDENFDDLKLRELFEEFAKNNPDKVIHG